MKRQKTKVLNTDVLKIAVILAMILPFQAKGYERTQTCGDGYNTLPCEEGQEPKPLYWKNRCQGLYLSEVVLPKHLSLEKAAEVISKSADAWSSVTCTDFELEYKGLSNETRVGYFQDEASNANLILFRRENWPHDPLAVALTSVTFDFETGEIYDADIELNDEHYEIVEISFLDRSGMDLENTLTHELGHFLGLDHSEVRNATMYYSATAGETSKRTLEDDDREGLCAIYPMGSGVKQCREENYFEMPMTKISNSGDQGCCCVCIRQKREFQGFVWVLGILGWILMGIWRVEHQ